jgi:hypothetical protein
MTAHADPLAMLRLDGKAALVTGGDSGKDEFEATDDASFAQRFQSIRARNQAADAPWWRVILLGPIAISPLPARYVVRAGLHGRVVHCVRD